MRIAFCLLLVILEGCAGARPAGEAGRVPSERPSAPPGAPATANPAPARNPTPTEYVAIANEMELRCAMREGDPRTWREFGRVGRWLYWYAGSGELVQRVLDENVVRIVPMGRRALVFTGIAHMVTDEGRATLLELDGGTWNVVHSLDLAGAPKAFLDEADGSILVVSGERLVRVSNASKVEILHRGNYSFWGPSSIVKGADGDLYIGSMYVVVRLRPLAVGYAETWLAPPGATRPRPPEEIGRLKITDDPPFTLRPLHPPTPSPSALFTIPDHLHSSPPSAMRWMLHRCRAIRTRQLFERLDTGESGWYEL